MTGYTIWDFELNFTVSLGTDPYEQQSEIQQLQEKDKTPGGSNTHHPIHSNDKAAPNSEKKKKALQSYVCTVSEEEGEETSDSSWQLHEGQLEQWWAVFLGDEASEDIQRNFFPRKSPGWPRKLRGRSPVVVKLQLPWSSVCNMRLDCRLPAVLPTNTSVNRCEIAPSLSTLHTCQQAVFITSWIAG